MGKRMIINALKKFYEMNDVILNWKKISQYMGEYQSIYARSLLKKDHHALKC